MEIIAQLFRALANHDRIRILRLLTVLGEQRVSELVHALSRLQGRVSAHLRVLATSGLVWRRRSGVAIYYRIADRPSSPVARDALSLLAEAFASIRKADPRKVACEEQLTSDVYSDPALLSYFTAFTHPRRLQIIRHLSECSEADLGAMAADLHMPLLSCSRHVAKLAQRNILTTSRPARRVTCILLPCHGAGMGSLLTNIVAELATRKG